MTIPVQRIITIREASQVGGLRRQAAALATEAGFGDAETGRVSLIATELANNLVLHAGHGRVLLQLIQNGETRELELLSIDSGPGMNVPASLRDGYSSAGTAGQGLGAISRASDEFEAYSQIDKGTVIMSRVRIASDRLQPPTQSLWRWGAINAAAPGETAIGDTWLLRPNNADMCVMMADGLGHGPLAAEAAHAAAGVFENETFGSLSTFYTRAHALLRSTRGAAIATALCPGAQNTLEFAGVGNISSSIMTRAGTSKHLMSHNGTVGAEMRPVKTLAYDWRAGDRIIMHSDGLTTRWSFKDYPEIMDYHPAIHAALLFRDHVRGKDDATVLVLERALG
ncbi:MAG: ATP-binding protein [Gemmatimonadaceae bacterium]